MTPFKSYRSFRSARLALALALIPTLMAAPSASAAPALKVSMIAPDHVTPGKLAQIVLAAQNAGDQPLAGNLVFKTTLPAGIPASSFELEGVSFNVPDPQCVTTGQEIECTTDATGVKPGVQIRFKLFFIVDPKAAGHLPPGQIEVSGAGAPGFSESLDFSAEPIGPFAIDRLDVEIGDAPSLLAAQAGADPSEITTRFELFSQSFSAYDRPAHALQIIAPPEQFRDVVAHVPPGLIGTPTSTPLRCTIAQLTSQLRDPDGGKLTIPQCPLESQVGVAQLNFTDIVPVYNIEPAPGVPAAFGFFYNSVVVTLRAEVRPSDNGIDIVTRRSVSSVPIPEFELTLWGAPEDPSHDYLRGACLNPGYGFNEFFLPICTLQNRKVSAFLRNPTSCPGTDLPWSIEMDTYQHPGSFVGKSTTTDPIEGCDSVPFDPEITLAPDARAAHSPTGLDVALSLPQGVTPSGIATSDLRKATVTLPEGVTINPASADGLAACSDAELRLGQTGPSNCLDSSKLGTVEVDTPLLTEQLDGAVFLRSQASKDPESGQLYRLAIELRSDERGVAIRLPGSLVADEDTGQLTATFDDLPQLPFEQMRLHFKTGPRAPLTTPSACGTYASHAELTGWSGAVRQLTPSFSVDQGCQVPDFDPGFDAGVERSTAGAFSPFNLRVTRGPGQPLLSRIDATLPKGELAKFAGVPLCPESAMATGACPAQSRIGTIVIGIGEGPSPLYLPQPGKRAPAIYIGGPYRGAPYSALAVVPAQAGPFDLGDELVRSAIYVDPETVRARIVSDPLPPFTGGIPIADRDVRVLVDRPDYTINPTDCDPLSTEAILTSSLGTQAARSDRFQLSDCAALGFKPKLSLALKGGVHRRAHPTLRATLTARPGDANIARAQVKLPPAAFLDQGHIGGICTRVQFAAHACPADSVYGRASATSPLLDYPVSGPVYLRSSSHQLPDLVASLHGPESAPIEVALVGRTDSVEGALRNTFEAVPDAPVGRFSLELFGGKRGLIEMSSGFCAHPRASIKLDGQNGRVYDTNPKVRAQCGKAAKKAGKRSRR